MGKKSYIKKIQPKSGDKPQDVSPEKREDSAPLIIRDILTALIVVAIIISGIYIYTQNWPPIVVIESKSMQHSPDESFVGVIDTGDLVLVKRVESESDLVSYVAGRASGHTTYSDYGDVIVYRKNGYTDVTPVIHRCFIWLEFNRTSGNYDVPELEGLEWGKDWEVLKDGILLEERTYNLSGELRIKNVGWYPVPQRRMVSINLDNIEKLYTNRGTIPESGYITMGDYNAPTIDQGWLSDGHPYDGFGSNKVRLVNVTWVVGKARGELPWFGLIKLTASGQVRTFLTPTAPEIAPQNSWHLLILAIIACFAIPVAIDMILAAYARRKRKDESDEATDDYMETDAKPYGKRQDDDTDWHDGEEDWSRDEEEDWSEDDSEENRSEDDGKNSPPDSDDVEEHNKNPDEEYPSPPDDDTGSGPPPPDDADYDFELKPEE